MVKLRFSKLRNSTKGLPARRVLATNSTVPSVKMAINASTRADPHPRSGASLRPISSATRLTASASSAGPSTSRSAGQSQARRSSNAAAPPAAIRPGTILMRNSQCHE